MSRDQTANAVWGAAAGSSRTVNVVLFDYKPESAWFLPQVGARKYALLTG